eukprot:scaffold49383_cov27-Tisochrysis_lutea.AAC.2
METAVVGGGRAGEAHHPLGVLLLDERLGLVAPLVDHRLKCGDRLRFTGRLTESCRFAVHLECLPRAVRARAMRAVRGDEACPQGGDGLADSSREGVERAEEVGRRLTRDDLVRPAMRRARDERHVQFGEGDLWGVDRSVCRRGDGDRARMKRW